MNTQHDDPNARSITTIAGQEVDTFFGCWIDLRATVTVASPTVWEKLRRRFAQLAKTGVMTGLVLTLSGPPIASAKDLILFGPDGKRIDAQTSRHAALPRDVQTISERHPAPGYARVHPGYFSILNGGNPQPGEAPWASVDGVARYANSPEGIDTIVRATYGPNGDGVLYPDALGNFKRWAAQYGMNENIVREVERKVNKRSASQGKGLNR